MTETEFKSRKEMEAVAAVLASTPALQREAAKTIDGVVVITVTRGKEKEVWVLEARDGRARLRRVEGTTDAKGTGTGTTDAAVRIETDDASLRRLVRGKTTAQALFMRGRLVLRGDLARARHVERVLASRAKL